MIVKNGYVFLEVLNPDDLYNWIKGLFIKYKLDESQLMSPDQYHVTLQYSKKPINNYIVSDYVYKLDLNDPLLKNKVELKLFDSKVNPKFKQALVLGVNDWKLKTRNNYGKYLGAVSDYPEYKPHITLAYLENDVQDSNFLKERPSNFTIELGNETIRDLDTEFKPMNNKL